MGWRGASPCFTCGRFRGHIGIHGSFTKRLDDKLYGMACTGVGLDVPSAAPFQPRFSTTEPALNILKLQGAQQDKQCPGSAIGP